MKTLTSTVGFQDEAGNLLGSLILTLPTGIYAVVSGGGQVAGQSLIINLDATGKVPGAITIWASDELSPQVPYAVTLCAQANGAQPVGTATWFISGTSPIDLSLMVQTSNGISYSGAVLTNPTSQQTINGQTLNIEGAPLGFSATGSTTPDSFFSRISSGVIAIGTAIGNALGTIMASAIKPPVATSFSISDPNGASHFFISGSAPYTNTFVNGNGSGVVFLGSAAKAAVSDTTGAVTTAGGVTLQTTAQTLPATVANDTAGGINITSNGGKTVNVGNAGFLNVLTPGAQLTLAGATSGSISVAPPAVAGSNTLTLPAATDTLVGRATVDNLINKNLLLAGSNNGVTLVNWQGPAAAIVGTGADANVYTFSIPANTMQAGKGIRISVGWQHTTGTASVTYKLKYGATTVSTNGEAGTGSASLVFYVMNNPGSTSAQTAWQESRVNNAITYATQFASPAENTTGAVTVSFTFSVAATDQVTPKLFLIESVQ